MTDETFAGICFYLKIRKCFEFVFIILRKIIKMKYVKVKFFSSWYITN
ncbi:hypothetical protein BFAG_04044 [Bacteroides fragilis 3_1_12]|uniref:Uncharacterized protein n=1 Tax=Bacteroides fragilis 3_1_12 TaxID=457424 RepID=A0ABN0BR14_BACFG|nr:hypothetical protein BFAG_04044 [Bacteroides fragilis 3_1_12]